MIEIIIFNKKYVSIHKKLRYNNIVFVTFGSNIDYIQ